MRKAFQQAPRYLDGEFGSVIDDGLFRRRLLARDRGLCFVVELGDLLGRLCKQILFFALPGNTRFRDQPFAFCGDLRARSVGVSPKIGCFLAGASCVGQQLLRFFLAFDDDIHDRPEKEPGEEPDQDEDVDGLQRQRPPIDAHGLNG